MTKKFVLIFVLLFLNISNINCMHRVTRAAILATRLPKTNLFKKSLIRRFPKRYLSVLTKSANFKLNFLKPHLHVIQCPPAKFEYFYGHWKMLYDKYQSNPEVADKIKGQSEEAYLRTFYEAFKECHENDFKHEFTENDKEFYSKPSDEKNISEILEELNQMIERFRCDLQQKRFVTKFKYNLIAATILTCTFCLTGIVSTNILF